MPQNNSLVIAQKLFPNETWLQLEENLFIAQSRQIAAGKNKNETDKLEKEIAFAKILAALSFSVVLVPERGNGKHFDAIIDGVRSELKTTNGNTKTIASHFNKAIKQGHNIFIRVLSDLSSDAIYSKLIGELKNHPRRIGKLFVFIEKEAKLYSWSIKEMSKEANKNKPR